MGRHAGWLTAASTLGKSTEEDGPHLVYVPEKIFNIDSFVKEVKEVYESLGRCLVAVSEGVHNEKGEYFLQTYADQSGSGLAGKKDSHGNIQLSGSGALGDTLANIVSENIQGARVRADTFGYLQRSFLADVSEIDADEAEAPINPVCPEKLRKVLSSPKPILKSQDHRPLVQQWADYVTTCTI